MKEAKKKSTKKKIRDLLRSIEKDTDPEVSKAKQLKLDKLKILKGLALKTTKAWDKYKTIRFFGRF